MVYIAYMLALFAAQIWTISKYRSLFDKDKSVIQTKLMTVVYRLDLRNEKWFAIFVKLRYNLAKWILELCQKIKGKFVMKTKKVIRKSPKKSSLSEKWFANHLLVIRIIANHFGKVIRNNPTSDSHFAKRDTAYFQPWGL